MPEYKALTRDNFCETSLDEFVRHQVVKEFWEHTDEGWRLRPTDFTEDWDHDRRREEAAEMLRTMGSERIQFGAFVDGRVVGYADICKRLFGSRGQYVELKSFQVSEPYRRMGIGKELFALAADAARRLGAKKLYISAHSSKESQAAYRALGCRHAEEIDKAIAENEPYDVQMEYVL